MLNHIFKLEYTLIIHIFDYYNIDNLSDFKL